MSSQFVCIYGDDFNICHCNSKFKYLWQGKSKLQTILKADKHTVDVLPTSTSTSSGIEITEADGPLLRFIVPWYIEDKIEENAATPVPKYAAQNPELPVPVKQLLTPNVTEKDPFIPNRSVCRVCCSTFFGNDHANSAVFHNFSPDQRHNDEFFCFLQNDECVIEPHPFASVYGSVMFMVVSLDPDTITLDKSLQQLDRHEFIKFMEKELRYHIDQKHWIVIPPRSIPSGKHYIPMLWSMKRKRDPLGKFVKWKARLCAGGHRSIESVYYWSTYSPVPVVSCSMVRFISVFSILNDWNMDSIDFVFAFPQAPIKTEIYVKPPKVPSGFLSHTRLPFLIDSYKFISY